MADALLSDADPFAGGADPFAAIGFEKAISPPAATDTAPPLTVHAKATAPAPAADSDPFGNGQNPFAAIGFEDLRPKGLSGTAAPKGPLSNSADDSYLSSLGKGVGTAVLKGLADIPGIAGNLNDLGQLGADYLFAGGQTAIGKLTGDKTSFAENLAKNEAARQAVHENMRKDLGGWIDYAKMPTGHDISQPVLNQVGEYVPQSEAGRLGMAGVEAAVGSVIPGANVGGVAANTGRQILNSTARTAANFSAGAVGQGVTDATDNPLLGAVAGAGTVGGFHAAGQGAAAAGNAIREQVPPLTQGGRNAAARTQVGRELNEAAIDPTAAIGNLQRQPREIIPDSRGTVGQISGDPGLLAYEKGVSQSPEGAPAFQQRATSQNNARVAYLDTVQPDGNPLDLPQGIRDQRAAADRGAAATGELADTVTAGHLARAQALHDQAVDDLRTMGPQAAPADVATHARSLRDAIGYQHELLAAEAQKAAEGARSATTPRAQSAEQAGANLREPAMSALQARKDADDALYAAARVPDGATIPTAKIAETAQSIQRGMLPEAGEMKGDEKRLFDLAGGYGDEESFNRIKALRTSILDQQAAVRRTDPAPYRRLNQLRQPVEDAIDHIVENRAALDQIAVQRGTMAPEDTYVARLIRERDEILASQRAGQAARASSGGSEPVRDSFLPPRAREKSQGDRGYGSAAGDQGIPPPSLDADRASSQVTPETAQALRTANASFRDRQETFGTGVVGDILTPARSGRGGFDDSNAEVPRQVFHPGPTGGEDVRAYLKAVGNERGVPAISDAAALALRDKAAGPDGVLDPKKIDAFLKDHKEALGELPAEVRGRFSTAANAERALADVYGRHRDAMSEFDKSEAGRIAGMSANGDVVARVGSILDSHVNPKQRLTEIAQAAKGNSAAESGLKRAVVEHVLNRFVPEVGDPKVDAIHNYLSARQNALSAVLGPEEIRSIGDRAAAVKTSKEQVATTTSNRQAALKQAEAARTEALSQYDRGILGQLKGVSTTGDVLNVIRGALKADNGAVRMGILAKQAAGIPGGTEALKRAVIESVQRDITSTTEAGATGQFEQKRAVLANFMRDRSDALRAAGLSGEQMGKLRAIVEDGMRSNRTITATKARGGSDTNPNAQRSAALKKGNGSILNELALSAALTTGGHMLGGTLGAFIGHGLGERAISALRDAGLDSVKKLRVEAVLDPDLGLALMQNSPTVSNQATAAKLALQARKLSIAGQVANRAQAVGR